MIVSGCCLYLVSYLWQSANAGDKLEEVIDRFDFRNRGSFSSPVGVNITHAPFMAWFEHPVLPTKCNAAIINKRFLVTAARCNQHSNFESYILTVGSDVSGKVDEKADRYEVETIFSHPKYRNDIMDHDIAVIKLRKELRFSNRVYSSHLFKVRLPFVSEEKCRKYLSESPVTNHMICVGDVKPKLGAACNYEYGSPLVYKGQLVGVMSFAHDGYPCSLPGFPTVFASVSRARKFIQKVISNKYN